MHPYLQAQPDDLPARTFGYWATDKLYYLQEYINRFSVSMHTKPCRNRRYIDLFAGTGKLHIKETLV